MPRSTAQVSWVNQRDRTVWINLGRADDLSRQVTFGVYSAGSNEVKQSKAGIEVTQILGDHLAEARILATARPTPSYPATRSLRRCGAPAKKRHFALAGLHGRQRRRPQRLGRDAKHHQSGRRRGRLLHRRQRQGQEQDQGGDHRQHQLLDPRRRPPDEKADPAQRDAFTKILREADQFRLPKCSWPISSKRIGWKNMSPWSATAAAPIRTTSAPSRTKGSCGSPPATPATCSRTASRRDGPQHRPLPQVLGVEGIDTRVNYFDTAAAAVRHRLDTTSDVAMK